MTEETGLGITFDAGLKYEKHLRAKIVIAQRNLGLLNKTFKFLDTKTYVVVQVASETSS